VSGPVPGTTAGAPAPGLQRRLRRVLRRLTAQHLRLDEIAEAVVRAIEEADLATARTSLSRFEEALRAHFVMEEDVDFPALLGLHPHLRDDLRRFAADHAQLLEDVASTAETLQQASRAEAHRGFDRLVVDLGAHELREERLLDSLTDGD
jgi:hypothetical protein